MSGFWTAVAAVVVGAGGLSYSGYAQSEANSDQKNAQEDAVRRANKQAQAQEEATNLANQKKPDMSAILAAAQQAAKGGASGTMLTGPQGAPTNTLGKTSLLGG